jgi:type IV secretory pathway VirB4 component
MVYGDTIAEVNRHVASAIAVLGDMGFIASVVTTATDAAFFAQLPANWQYRPRVDDEAFAEFAGNKQLTIKKQNGLGVFATQMPSSLLQSKIAAHLVQQCATEIYLPNTRADFEEYTTGKGGNRGFGLTPAEFNIVASLEDDSRMFLVKQGHRSSLAKLDLGGLGDELAVLSGSTDNIELLHQVMSEVGSEDPEDWMPIFLSRIRARKDRNRL